MRIIWRNLVDSATLTASPAMVETLPVGNLQTDAREEVARTTSLATQTIDVTLDQDELMQGCVLYRGNFSSGATWRVQVFEDDTMAVQLYDSGTLPLNPPKPLGDIDWGIERLGVTIYDGWGYTVTEHWFAPVVGQFARITLDDASNPDGFMQASRLFLGSYMEPSYMPMSGMTLGPKETTKQERSEAGTLHVEAGAQYRALTVAGRYLPEKTRAGVGDMQREAGMRRDVYVSVFADENTARARDYRMQARLVQLDTSAMGATMLVDQQLRFEET